MELQIMEHWWFGIQIWDTPKNPNPFHFPRILEIQTTENPNPPLNFTIGQLWNPVTSFHSPKMEAT